MAKKKKTTSGQHFRDEVFLRALGAHCRKLRISKGYSVNRLAYEGERLSPSVVMRLESGKGAVTVITLKRYAEVLDVPLRKLFDFHEI